MKTKEDRPLLEKEASIICRDFTTFCNYLAEKKVKLSKQTRCIGKRDCFELNSQFYTREAYEKPTHFQNRYPIINLFNYVAVKYEILKINLSEKVMDYGENYKLYQNSTVLEQYTLFLLNVLLDGRFLENGYYFIKNLEQVFVWVEQEKLGVGDIGKIPARLLNGFISLDSIGIISYLEELRLVKVLNRYKQFEGLYNREYESEILPLFPHIAVLYKKTYIKLDSEWEKNNFISQSFKIYMDNILQEQNDYHLQKIFEDNNKSNHRTEDKIIDLEVKIRQADCSRVLRMMLSDSLYSLHTEIQKAFQFDGEQWFSFYIGYRTMKKAFTAAEFITYEDEEPAEETSLRDLELCKDQNFSYLLDYYDTWWFDIKVLDIKEGAVQCPSVIKAVNKAPKQYPDEEKWWYGQVEEEMTVGHILASVKDGLIESEYSILNALIQKDEEQEETAERKRQKMEQIILDNPDKMLAFMTPAMRERLGQLLREESIGHEEKSTILQLSSLGFCMFSEEMQDVIFVPECIAAVYGEKIDQAGDMDQFSDAAELALRQCGVMEMEKLYLAVSKLVKRTISYEDFEILVYSRLYYWGRYYRECFAGKEVISCYESNITEKILIDRLKPENAQYSYPDFENIEISDLRRAPEALKKWVDYVQNYRTLKWENMLWLIANIPLLASSGIKGKDEIIAAYKDKIHRFGGKATKKAEKLILDLCNTIPLATRKGH